jgi:molecular chaperone GrpE
MSDERLETPAADDPAADAPQEQATGTTDVAQVTKERDDYYDRLLRKTAEFDNYRKRIDRERQQLAESAAADLIKDLLPLVDDMECALKADAGSEAAAPIRKGVELIHKQLLDTLRKRGVTPVDALNTDFDPHFHMAVAYEPAEGRRDGEVIEEFSRGYMLGDRLLRPAMVKVAKG